MAKYHYEHFAYTDNMNYGRMLIGHDRSRAVVRRMAIWANKGCYRIERHRVYETN